MWIRARLWSAAGPIRSLGSLFAQWTLQSHHAGAAFAQTLRNAAQRQLTTSLGTLGATLVRFLYGLPFAVSRLVAVHLGGRYELPTPNAAFAGWIAPGSLAQIAATALLLCG